MDFKEFKFYKSYLETFENLPNEDAGKLIKRMSNFYFNWKDKKSDSMLVEAIFPQIKYTMEKSLKWKQTWGIRSRVPSRVPSTTPSTNDKDKDNIKKENIKEEAIRFIEFWNKLFNKNHKATDDFINAYISKRKKYSKEDIVKWIQAYHLKNKNNLNDEWYNNYYLVPLKFIKQSNGFISYL